MLIKYLLGARQTRRRSLEWGRRASLLLRGAHRSARCAQMQGSGAGATGGGVPGPAPPAPPGLASHQHRSPSDAASTMAKWTNVSRSRGDSALQVSWWDTPPPTNTRITPGRWGRGGRGGPLGTPGLSWRCGGWGTPKDSGGSSRYGGEVWGPKGISGGRAGVLRATGAFLEEVLLGCPKA